MSLRRRLGQLPQTLRRRTSAGPFIPQIDGLRFIAILAVVVSHITIFTINKAHAVAPDWVMTAHANLARGVQLFFVISGFVIAMPFVAAASGGKARVRLADYFLRRLTRLEPPFLVAMAVTFAALVLIHGSAVRPLLGHFLATCTYTHGLIYHTKSPIAFITWSLEIEVQFYLIAPLILRALHLTLERRRLLLAATAIAAWAVPPARSADTLLPWLSFFIAGILVADAAHATDYWKTTPRGWQWDAAAATSFAIVFGVPDTTWAESPLAAALFAVCLIAAFRGRALPAVLSGQWVSAIGGMCYTIYLFHEPLIYFLGKFTGPVGHGSPLLWNLLLQHALLLPLLFAAASILFLVLEKPCMNKRWPQELTHWCAEVVSRRRGISVSGV